MAKKTTTQEPKLVRLTLAEQTPALMAEWDQKWAEACSAWNKDVQAWKDRFDAIPNSDRTLADTKRRSQSRPQPYPVFSFERETTWHDHAQRYGAKLHLITKYSDGRTKGSLIKIIRRDQHFADVQKKLRSRDAELDKLNRRIADLEAKASA